MTRVRGTPKKRIVEKTEAEIEKQEREKLCRLLTRRVVASCSEVGVFCMKLQLDFLIATMDGGRQTILPTKLSLAETIDCFRLGIVKFEEARR